MKVLFLHHTTLPITHACLWFIREHCMNCVDNTTMFKLTVWRMIQRVFRINFFLIYLLQLSLHLYLSANVTMNCSRHEMEWQSVDAVLCYTAAAWEIPPMNPAFICSVVWFSNRWNCLSFKFKCHILLLLLFNYLFLFCFLSYSADIKLLQVQM